MSSVVLITTANNPPKGIPALEMTNVATRHITAKAAVFFWAASGIEKIVIADATGSRLLNEEDILSLSRMGVAVEQISYLQDEQAIREKGKGYGEGMLIKYALESSETINAESSFFKCTGKIYCRNFHKIVQLIDSNRIKNFFWRYLGEGDSPMALADTRFFYTTKTYCEENIIPAYLKTDEKESLAEIEIFKILNETLGSAKALRPMLSGFSGGTGGQYFDASLGSLDYNFPCWVEC